MENSSSLNVVWRGRERYSDTWQYQLSLHIQRKSGGLGDTLILVEHEPVVTLGRHGDISNLVAGEYGLQQAGIDFHRVERGGDITYHGPGQLVGYPIVNLRERQLSVHEFVFNLEESIISLLETYGLKTSRVKGMTGVWHEQGKVAAIGVAVQGGVSFHGFAINVDTDLSHYDNIIPCGITGRSVASIGSITGLCFGVEDVKEAYLGHFKSVFGY